MGKHHQYDVCCREALSGTTEQGAPFAHHVAILGQERKPRGYGRECGTDYERQERRRKPVGNRYRLTRRLTQESKQRNASAAIHKKSALQRRLRGTDHEFEPSFSKLVSLRQASLPQIGRGSHAVRVNVGLDRRTNQVRPQGADALVRPCRRTCYAACSSARSARSCCRCRWL
jgi:hypothetical protein